MPTGENATAARGGGLGTCTEFIEAVSSRELPDNPSVQVCVLSLGFNLEGIVAQLLYRRMTVSKTHRRVYCVVFPDRRLPGVMARFASYIERHLMLRHTKGTVRDGGGASAEEVPRQASPIPVIAIEEGTSTKERCAVFQRGAVVVLTGQTLCADLLHRRLAAELVGMAVLVLPNSVLGGARLQDALAPQTAFCVQLLLGSGTSVTGGQGPPPITLISDAPMLMRYLVQRHHLGAERFVQELQVSDIQLFPRFRLDFVRHFEELSRTAQRSLVVDRIVAPVAPSVLALDGLLKKIVLETLQELQRLERQLHAQRSWSSGSSSAGILVSGGSRTDARPSAVPPRAAAAEADEDAGAFRFLPRARLSAGAGGGHISYTTYPRDATASDSHSTSYIRHGWRATAEHDDKGMYFGGIDEEAAVSVDFSELDSDLRAVVRRHESNWPYRLLTESLIDVRRLRRATRGTAYSFLLELESVLERRLPQRSVYGTGTPPPAALWTLSSHFHEVVTVATHRVGAVVYVPSAAPVTGAPPAKATAAGTTTSTEDVVVVVDSSSDNDERAAQVPVDVAPISATAGCPGPSTATTGGAKVPQLIPNTDEHEGDVEVVVRLVLSWCRTMLRRLARRERAHANVSEPHPAILLLTLGPQTVVRYTERLTNALEVYKRLQLQRFMRVYRAKYGVELMEFVEEQAADDVATQLPTALAGTAGDAEDVPSDEEGDWATDEGKERDSPIRARGTMDTTAYAMCRVPREGARAASAAPRGVRVSHAEWSIHSQTLMEDIGAGPFHQALLSRLPPPRTGHVDELDMRCDAEPRPASPASRVDPLLKLERVREGVVTLCPHDCAIEETGLTATVSSKRIPRVLVLDASAMSATELTMLLDGSHSALQFGFPSTADLHMSPVSTCGGEGAEGASARLRVDRVVLARQHLVLLRQLEVAQDELPAERLAAVKVQLITTSLAEVDFKKAVQTERQAFESLAHTKATLTGTLLAAQSSLRQTEEALESGFQMSQRRAGTRKATIMGHLTGSSFNQPSLLPTALPCVVFDEREFRSSLPYNLYRCGMQLIPLTLTTADYVLSPEYAVERKGLQDYFSSVMSGRIRHQLGALTRKYARPLCLIEFQRGLPFRLTHSAIYAKTAALMASYPRVSFLWARSSAHAAGMLVLLKKSVAVTNMDPADPSLTGTSMNPGTAADVGGDTATAAEREAAHYAARVLSKFPGITRQNAPRVMQICGSLIGLATISQASLVAVMGEEDAGRLYKFLHTPFYEQVV